MTDESMGAWELGQKARWFIIDGQRGTIWSSQFYAPLHQGEEFLQKMIIVVMTVPTFFCFVCFLSCCYCLYVHVYVHPCLGFLFPACTRSDGV